MSIQSEKEALRNECRSFRKELSQQAYEAKSAAISENLSNFFAKTNHNIVHTFLPVTKRHEPDINPFLNTTSEIDIVLMVPITTVEGIDLEHVWYLPGEELKLSEYDIPIPVKEREADPTSAEIVIVPMLAADLRGYRLGYGKGFYDRFLATVRIPSIGICFSEELHDSIPFEMHDQTLDWIITDRDIVQINPFD